MNKMTKNLKIASGNGLPGAAQTFPGFLFAHPARRNKTRTAHTSRVVAQGARARGGGLTAKAVTLGKSGAVDLRLSGYPASGCKPP
jgi:hypothetical protein